MLSLSVQMFFGCISGRLCLQRWAWQSVKMEALWVYSLLKRYDGLGGSAQCQHSHWW